ncbi:MAG: UDP-N-acetylmuramoyl-L-alanyl-D-glutamate--2,6-diaminopimelate ligase [Candidatus Parcubacteria bacterium]|nr:MAG: UDP-N-acetylmuramoyl-L-alanyl-D-glutamate--2,6-diaminopimelate ligase [Candidatus Parcubacteria bacterium]
MSFSWQKVNNFLETLKKFPLFKILYKIPFAPWFYHFLLAWMGAVIYSFPSRKIKVIGVTGTKGKSTTVELISFLLEKAGYKTSFFSSVHIKIGDKKERNYFGNSSPGRFFLQYFLKKSLEAGCHYAIVEVTSQGVVFSRHRFIKWSGGVFLNIHPEHIEAHGSFEKYLKAKTDFFRYAAKNPNCSFFINKDDPHFLDFQKAAGKREVVLFSGKEINLKESELPSGLWGDFNKVNIAAAWAVAQKEGASEEILKFLKDFEGLEGRMDFVQREPFAVIVDYAHTPDSLEAIYQTVSRFKEKEGKMICVLGSCGGGRDKWKRPKMGEIAASFCDYVILTNEDPYDEDPMIILDEIEAGFKKNNLSKQMIFENNYWKIIDRKEALRKAIDLANKGDVVIATGKGSELWIHLANGQKIPWSERKVFEEILKTKKEPA